jgi:hypothetical protein
LDFGFWIGEGRQGFLKIEKLSAITGAGVPSLPARCG